MAVSIVMSVYAGDKAHYLEHALQSIADQTLKNYELVLVEDGAVGADLQAVINSFRSSITIKSVALKQNKGLATALNAGISNCKNELIARMDADDIMLPARLEKQRQYFLNHPETDILGTWAIDIDHNGNAGMIRKTPVRNEDIIKKLWSCPMIHPSVMIKKESLQFVGGYNASLPRHQDYDLWFRLAKARMVFANIPEPLIKYRYADAWNIKNDFSTMWLQVKIGWQGCRLVSAPLSGYVGAALPLLKVMLPKKLIANQGRLLKRVDPREN